MHVSWLNKFEAGARMVKPFPNDKYRTLPNWKTVQATILTFEDSGRKFSEIVKSSEGKGEIARYEQFLLFPQCFQKDT